MVLIINGYLTVSNNHFPIWKWSQDTKLSFHYGTPSSQMAIPSEFYQCQIQRSEKPLIKVGNVYSNCSIASIIDRLMTKPTKWHVHPAKTDQPGHPRLNYLNDFTRCHKIQLDVVTLCKWLSKAHSEGIPHYPTEVFCFRWYLIRFKSGQEYLQIM